MQNNQTEQAKFLHTLKILGTDSEESLEVADDH